MSRWFILGDDGRTPIEVDLVTGAAWYESARENRIVAKTAIGDATASTVFLALDHQFDPDGPPLLFETLVFGGPHDGDMRRYSTWDEAVRGHNEVVEELTALRAAAFADVEAEDA